MNDKYIFNISLLKIENVHVYKTDNQVVLSAKLYALQNDVMHKTYVLLFKMMLCLKYLESAFQYIRNFIYETKRTIFKYCRNYTDTHF